MYVQKSERERKKNERARGCDVTLYIYIFLFVEDKRRNANEYDDGKSGGWKGRERYTPNKIII